MQYVDASDLNDTLISSEIKSAITNYFNRVKLINGLPEHYTKLLGILTNLDYKFDAVFLNSMYHVVKAYLENKGIILK